MRVSRRSFVESIRVLERLAEANRQTADWLARIAGDESAIEHFSIVQGEFSDQLGHYAEHVSARAIVVPASEETSGCVVTELACRTGVPVLVAREAGSHATIVAATDLRDSEYPVLNKAAEMARQLRTPIVTIHNVNALGVGLSFEMDWPVVVVRSESAQRAIAEQLFRASRELNVDSRPVLRHDLSPVAAIVAEACGCDADLIVVGARARQWFDLPVFGSVASQVVNRAHCSVLVLPLRPSDQAQA